jgi:predicted amidohydrolase
VKISSLQLQTSQDYQQNLDNLVSLIQNCDSDLILAPEVCITGFDYKNFQKANEFSTNIKETISQLSKNKIISLTLIEDNKNIAYVFYEGKEIYKKEKEKLFLIEDKYFQAGDKKPEVFEIDGVKYALLICFELRFIEYWSLIKEADIILIPAQWGVQRKNHLITLSNALALSNQSFVVLSDGANSDMAKSSGVISPWQEEIRDDNSQIITTNIDLREIKRVRKKLPIRGDK